MAAVTTIVAGTALLASGPASQVYAADRQKKAERANRRAAEAEQRKAAIQNARARRRAVAQAQISQAQLQASQAATGYVSSGTTNQVGAIGAQTAGNIGFQTQLANMNNFIIGQQQRASSAMSQANIGLALGQVPGQLGFSLGGMTRSFFSGNNS